MRDVAKGLQRKNIILQAIGVVLFLTLPLVLTPRPPGIPLFNITLPAFRDLIAGVLMLAFLYLNYFILVSKFLIKRRYARYGLTIFIGFVIIIYLPSIILSTLGFMPVPPLEKKELQGAGLEAGYLVSIGHNILLFLSVIVFSTFLKVQQRLFKTEQAKNHMEILSLREQINPHFLFNILNTIYGQAIMEKAHGTSNSIIKLSGLLRHIVHETENKYVLLKKEIEYIESYILLQKQRLGEQVELVFTVKGEIDEDRLIAPLLLVPFMENAFKHGINPDEKSRVEISITLENNSLSLTTFNKKVNVRLQPHEKSGAGIKITISRLELLYSGKYKLEVNDLEETYRLNLQISLDD